MANAACLGDMEGISRSMRHATSPAVSVSHTSPFTDLHRESVLARL